MMTRGTLCDCFETANKRMSLESISANHQTMQGRLYEQQGSSVFGTLTVGIEAWNARTKKLFENIRQLQVPQCVFKKVKASKLIPKVPLKLVF